MAQYEVCELVRIALKEHQTPVSRILAIALKMFHKHSPNVKLLVSYADTSQGHHGGIYQASGWRYIGSTKQREYVINGVKTHPRTMSSSAKRHNAVCNREFIEKYHGNLVVSSSVKHKYIYPLHKNLQLPPALPYPKRCVEPVASDGTTSQVEQACATHSSTLQTAKSEEMA